MQESGDVSQPKIVTLPLPDEKSPWGRRLWHIVTRMTVTHRGDVQPSRGELGQGGVTIAVRHLGQLLLGAVRSVDGEQAVHAVRPAGGVCVCVCRCS